MSAATVQETIIHQSWCDPDCDGELLHWRWIRGDGWQVQAVRYDDGQTAVHAAINNGSDELPVDDAPAFAEAILAAVATLQGQS